MITSCDSNVFKSEADKCVDALVKVKQLEGFKEHTDKVACKDDPNDYYSKLAKEYGGIALCDPSPELIRARAEREARITCMAIIGNSRD